MNLLLTTPKTEEEDQHMKKQKSPPAEASCLQPWQEASL